MSQYKNAFLSDCYGSLKNIIVRLVSEKSGTEEYLNAKHDFERLQCDFREFSAHLDPQDKDLQNFSRYMEKTGEIFTKVDPLICI
jgi:hypothetical protein